MIANDNYDHFADTLQKDFNDTMAFNRDEVTAEILTTTLEKSGVPVEEITPELYKFDLDQESFIRECIVAVNEDLSHRSDTLSYEVTTGTSGFDEVQKFALKNQGNKIMEVYGGLPGGNQKAVSTHPAGDHG